MFVGAAEGFHFDFASVFFKAKGQSDDAYQTNGVDDGDEDTSESYLEYQRKAKRGGEGKRDKEGRGKNKQQRGQHCKGDILDYEGSSLASDKTEWPT